MQMSEWIEEAVSGFFYKIIDSMNSWLISQTIPLIKSTVLDPTDPGRYLSNWNNLQNMSVLLASSLFSVFVVMAVFRQISGTLSTGDRSVGKYVIDISMAGLLIFFLPLSVTKVLLPINNILINKLSEVGVSADKLKNVLELSTSSGYGLTQEFNLYGVLALILIIAFIVLAIAGAIRYIETLLIILVAPLFALSLINNSDGVQIWFREAISVIFTQTIHFLMILFILSTVGGVESTFVSIMLTIGAIAVALKGPQILRQFLYRTGTGSVMVSSAGEVSRLGAMSMMFKK